MISVTSALSVLVLVLVLIACYFYRQNKQKIRSRDYVSDHSISSQSVVLKDLK
jgi:hypothetical protein